jgi:hypothetical protein
VNCDRNKKRKEKKLIINMGPLTSLSFLSLSNPLPLPLLFLLFMYVFNFSERINVSGSK